jgi:hypothetical protein
MIIMGKRWPAGNFQERGGHFGRILKDLREESPGGRAFEKSGKCPIDI